MTDETNQTQEQVEAVDLGVEETKAEETSPSPTDEPAKVNVDPNADAEIEADKLAEYEPAELDEGDLKIAKKRAKKANVPEMVAQIARQQEKSWKMATALTVEYHKKLNGLGFVLATKIAYNEQYIRPVFDLRPMSEHEIQTHKKAVEDEAKKESEAQADKDMKSAEDHSIDTNEKVEGEEPHNTNDDAK